LFGDRRQDVNAPVAEFKNGFAEITFLVAHFDAVQSADFYLAHLVGHGVVALAREPVHTGPQQKMGAGILGDREQFIDVALTITDMDKTLRRGKQRRRLLHVFKPAIALLLFDGNAGRVDLALQGIGSVELFPGPELDGGQPKRKTLLRDDQAGMHQNPAHRMVARPAVIPSLLLAHHTDGFVLLTAVDEFRRVVKYQQRTADTGLEPLLRAGKMPSQNLFFRDAIIRQKPIGCLRRCPVLASERDASADLLRELSKQSAEPFAMPRVIKSTACRLMLQPTADPLIGRLHTRSPAGLYRD